MSKDDLRRRYEERGEWPLVALAVLFVDWVDGVAVALQLFRPLRIISLVGVAEATQTPDDAALRGELQLRTG